MPKQGLKKFVALAAISTVMASCTTTDPYTGEERTSRAVQFGAIGTVVCGLIGAAESGKRARNAAAGCGAIGVGVGAYMDAQESELREELASTGVRVERNGDRLDLVMPGNITFETDEYRVKPEFYPVLDSVARVLAKYEDTTMQVYGHTDSTGDSSYNYQLSDRRATSVSNYLASQGISQSRLLAQGLGPDQPIASNSSASGRALNRRVELQIHAAES